MAKTLFYLFKEARPRQWVKNLIIFTAIFFSGQLFNGPLLLTTLLAFIAFCLSSSSIYYINDITDVEKDRLHPFKKNRPIASGKISKNLGLSMAAALFLGGFLIAGLISWQFVLIMLLFFGMHIVYSLFIKNIMLLDILTIAAGFIIRVFAGEVATGYHINIWLLLTVISASLFIAIGKRRSELTLLSGSDGVPARTRATLSHYSEKMLDVYISMFANSTWITYAFYTFLAPTILLPEKFRDLFDVGTQSAIQERKWLTLTIPFVIYGIMRYLQLIYEKNEGESPEKILMSDRPLIVTAGVLGVMLFTIIYILG